MIKTRVGYAGGTNNNPVYFDLGDHAETVQIEYDPTIITYEDLLDVFWDSHDPTIPAWSRQYMSIILYHNEDQNKAAQASIQQQAASTGKAIMTEVIPLVEFFPAEDYHQKYFLQLERELLQEFRAMYPDMSELIQSTAAARINGYIGGYGKPEIFEEQINSYGLSASGKEKLLDIVVRR